MKRFSAALLLSLISVSAMTQSSQSENTLLWKISGKGLDKPSYLFGTIHMICSEDAVLGDNLRKVISDCDEVYFEVDMDNLLEIFGAMNKMKMKGDTTFKDLMSPEDYTKVKNYFDKKERLLPFSVLETYKPILAASTLEETDLPCENTSMMEQVIMEEAKTFKKRIRGLETMSSQAGVLDSIPYKLQADQLVAYIDKANSGEDDNSEMKEMFKAYKNQDLKKLEEMMVSMDAGMAGFTDILLYHRNLKWVETLKDVMHKKSLLIAVGAGHLPGEKGVIQLLRKQGYKVTPVENKIIRAREI